MSKAASRRQKRRNWTDDLRTRLDIQVLEDRTPVSEQIGTLAAMFSAAGLGAALLPEPPLAGPTRVLSAKLDATPPPAEGLRSYA